MNAWMIRGGSRDEFVAFARDYDVSVLGFYGTPDFSSTASFDQLRQQVEANYPKRTKGTVTRFTNEIADFLWNVEPGDLIVMPYRRAAGFSLEPQVQSDIGSKPGGWRTPRTSSPYTG